MNDKDLRIAELEKTVEQQGDQIIEIRAANRHLREDLEAAERKLATCKRLVDKLHAVHADDRYKAVWMCYALHGGNYTEPRYEQELKDATEALNESNPK